MVGGIHRALVGILLLALVCPNRSLVPSEYQGDSDLVFEDAEAFVETIVKEQKVEPKRERRQADYDYVDNEFGSGDYAIDTYRAAIYLNDRMHPEYLDKTSQRYESLRQRLEMELNNVFSELMDTWQYHLTNVGESGDGTIKISIDFVHTGGDEDETDLNAVLSSVLRQSSNLNVDLSLLELRRVADTSSGRCAEGEQLCPNGECVPRCNGIAECQGGGDEIGCDHRSADHKEKSYRASVVLKDRTFTSDYSFKGSDKYAKLVKDIEGELSAALAQDNLVKATVKSFGLANDLNRVRVELELMFRDPSYTTLDVHKARFVSALRETQSLRSAQNIHFRAVRDVATDICLAEEAMCSDGQCVPRCNGTPDCDGGEDELGCPQVEDIGHEATTPGSCTNDQFKCNDGECIANFRRCDFVQDCLDNSDETSCPCEPPNYQCNSGMCIQPDKRCDGIPDCDDESDENTGCLDDSCDGSGMLTCDDGDTCIEDAQICDGTVDCDDGSDENECDAITTQTPPITVACTAGSEFQCVSGGRCLSIDLKCNGKYDCSDRSDEKDCHIRCEPDEFKCSDGICLSPSEKCDGKIHCSDGEDEINCFCRESNFRCQNGQCVDDSYVCNGYDDCFDGSDELDCSGTTRPPPCPSDQFSCDNGQCVSIGFTCDGIPDCDDGSDELSRTCGSPSHTCSPNEFQCNNGNCIDIKSRCDASNDCLDDSDEIGCPESQQCTGSQFRCGDGMCVDKGWRCDGISDCNDSSDEISCNCKLNEFQCGSGECITETFACDNKQDCKDGSDEKGCPCKEGEFACREGGCVLESLVCDKRSDCHDASDEDPELCTKCASYEFECSSGECVFATQRCNGVPECADRSDEIGCPGIHTCSSHEFKCLSGECVSRSVVCDQRNDCLDNSDESNCTGAGDRRVCNSAEFTCSDGSCVNLLRICDDRYDCSDGSDELACTQTCGASQFACHDGQCISRLVQCDGRSDCLDGSDEHHCPVSSYCGDGQFSCRNNGECIPSHKRCDQRYDCRDRSDEENCAPSCRLDEFRCTSGECVSVESRCNYHFDCYDRSDEADCPSAVRCTAYQFSCRDARQCIDLSSRCDRKFDCLDKSDEENCPDDRHYRECRPDQYACGSGECIDGKLRCDNTYNCPDGTDEYGCTPTTTRPRVVPTTTSRRACRLDEYTCDNGYCIPASQRCNRNYDCSDQSDEYHCAPAAGQTCSSNEFSCKDRQQCVDLRAKCNGYFDCFDRSDEQDCSEICRNDQFTCTSGECIETTSVCDGIYNCPDASDESNCVTNVDCAPSHEFACLDGRQCVAKGSRCNRRYDCIDRSDEENCQETFDCRNGDRIPIKLRCDGYEDCRDASDEYGCAHGCDDDEFLCRTSTECISKRKLCDGAYDCRDRSDEQFCPEVKPDRPVETGDYIKLVTIPSNQTIEQGRQVVFRCRDEGDTRAPVRWVRQGHNILPPRSTDVRGRLTIEDVQVSYSGDYYCEAQGVPLNAEGRRRRVHLVVIPFVKPTAPPGLAVCAYNQTTCRSGMCISKSSVCDGKFDCDDHSDEDRCNPLGCEPNEFECDNRRCVQKSWVCDSDDDCQDGSDERNCGVKAPGQKCEMTEFVCKEQEQCIPKYFVCDNEMDCFDGTDEFGCSKPIITKHPARKEIVEIGETFIITCRAVGMPVPEISWRYNWGHVPTTCTSTSVNGLGTLTCLNVQVNHQGAYSCEATNSLGRVFGVPDAIIQIKESGVTGICAAPMFNAGAVSQRDCIRCFCFGITDQCSSSGQFVAQLPAPSGAFKIIGVNQDQFQGIYVIRANEYPIPSTYVRTISVDRVEINIPNRERLGGPTDLLLYFALPHSYTGPQIGSYGGFLRYKISHQVSGSSQTLQGPDVILRGNNITIMYVNEKALAIGADAQLEIRLWPGQWYKKIVNRGGRIQSQELATRDDIMSVLQNIELILIRASYSDAVALQATLTGVQLDTVSYSASSERAYFVESCRCPPGYAGTSCEECAPNYRRVHDGTLLGRCSLNITCGRTEFGDPANGIPCQLCPCPLTNPSNQFSQSCYLDGDGQVTCNCQFGYSGRRCELCASGYIGNPSIPGDSCRPAGQCDKYGSLSLQPDPISGLCQCKEHTTGPKCSQCQPSSFHLNENNRHGCIRCFCMGVSNNCTSSNWYRTQEVIGFVGDTQGFLLVDQYQLNTIMNNIYVDGGKRELVYREFPQLSPDVYYWKLPRNLVKDKITSYGGNLTYTFRYSSSSRQPFSSRNAPYDVEIYGNDVSMRYFSSESPPQSGNTYTFTVPLYEMYWKRQDGQVGNREHFLMALADIEYILIRATYSDDATEASLMEVRMDYATSRNTGQQRAFAVESCDCPQGYRGLSCEDCAPGYTRDLTALYLGECRICDCNGHSEECDPETGICTNCRNNRAGEYCERCASGFTEDYTGLCVRREGCHCDPRGSLSSECVNGRCLCKDNVEGDECKTCSPGYFHLPESNANGCLKCWCAGVTNRCASSYLTRQQIPMNLFDGHNFTLTDRQRTDVVKDFEVNIGENQLTFSDFDGLRYHFSQSEGSNVQIYYWSLPQLFTGNKLNAYGGYLRLKQHFTSKTSADLFADEDIIIIGANQKKFVWMDEMRPLSNTMQKNISVQLTEDNFSHNHAPARREDFLSALASVEAILVRATLTSTITSSSLRDVVMDTAVDYASGQTRALEVEQCSCPVGHVGNSCEDCAQGYYKDSSQRCQRCECSGKEQSCSLDRNRRLECICLPGYSGERCEISGGDRTVPVGIFEVRIIQSEYIVQEGSTIELLCTVSTPDNYQMTIAWDRAGGPLPIRRVHDDRLGTLAISQVRPEDSGVYICRASTGVQVKEARTYLNVTGGQPPYKPIVVIDEQREELYIRIGEYFTVRCRARGSPPPQVQWHRQDGKPLSLAVSQSNGQLTLNNPQRGDAGTYVCLGRNREGSTQATIIIHVEKESVMPPVGGNYIIVQVPEIVEAHAGGFVRIHCTVSADHLVSSYEWSRMRHGLPKSATQVRGELVITEAKPADSGLYTCTVTDNQGRIGKSTTDVVILPSGSPPEVKIQPDRQTVNQGTSAELKCIVVGEPRPTITWTKDNEEMGPNARVVNDVLRIENAQVADRGLYRCTAVNINGQGVSVGVLEVEMREPPVIEMYPDNRATIRKGESASFLCHLIKGFPEPIISWARTDGRPLTENTETPSGGVIKFYQVSGNEEGSYICTAVNDAGKMTAVATLEIEAIPVIKLTPSSRSITVKSGERIRLECTADGDPSPTVSWQILRTNLPQTVPSKSITPRLSVYEVASARINDQGIYQCTALNNAGTTIERIQVIVQDTHPTRPVYPPQPPTIDTSGRQRKFQVPLGGQFEFRCIVEGLDSDARQYSYEFRRSDGRPLPREHVLGPRTLTVTNVDRASRGEYACIISEIETQQVLMTIYAKLEIIDPPRITLEPARQVVRPGDNANLRCSVTGDQPITIKWSKQTGPMPASVAINGEMLMFRGIQVTDAGKYLCEAVNPVGSAEAVAEVLVNERPLLTSLQQQVTLSEGQDGVLRCIASGLPSSAVQWLKDGKELPNNFRAAGNVLRIYQASIENSGRYTCQANTQTGESTHDYVELLVQPSTTANIKVRASTDYIQLGDNVDLHCHVSNQPSAYISWSKRGGHLPPNSQVDGNTLRLINVDKNSGGVYVCSAQTESGVHGQLEMQYPLTIQNTLSSSKSVETRSAQFGSTVILRCGGATSGTFVWSKQGGQLPSRAVIQEEFLEIPEVEAHDAGTYLCSLGNSQQGENSPTLLVVTGVIPSFNGESYLALPTLQDAYLYIDLEISIKPERGDGLILYNSQQEGQGDFVSFGLNNSFAEFRFDVGSGPGVLRSLRPLKLGEWHTIKLTRDRKEGTLSVDGGRATLGMSQGRFQGLDLMKPLYIGGLPDFSLINREAGFTTGFVGCVSQLVMGRRNTELMRAAHTKHGVAPCNTCSGAPCQNGGICQEAYSPTGHKCTCSPGFSDASCESTGEQCHAGICGMGRCVDLIKGIECQCPFGTVGHRCEMNVDITEPAFGQNSYLAYNTPRASGRFSIGLNVKPSNMDDGIIMYCAQNDKGDGDFASLTLRDRRIEFRFNTGTGTAILRSDEVSPGQWIKVHANRTHQTGSLRIDDGEMQSRDAPGSSRGLNIKTPLFFGGVDTSQIQVSPEVQVDQGFTGCLSNLEIMDQTVRLGDAIQDSVNVEQCGVSPCSRDPCRNGGSCHDVGTLKYRCSCPAGFTGSDCETRFGICASEVPCLNGGVCEDISDSIFDCHCHLGYSGRFCQDESHLQESAAFVGNSWLEFDRYLLPHDGISEQQIHIEFTTTFPSGLIFWLGQNATEGGEGKDFLSLGVVDGFLEMTLGMGGESNSVMSDTRVDNGIRHSVLVNKLGDTASMSLDNGLQLRARAPENSFTFNTYGNIFIGGVPNMALMTGSKFAEGFDGCIHTIRFGTKTIDRIINVALDGVNLEYCHQTRK